LNSVLKIVENVGRRPKSGVQNFFSLAVVHLKN